MRSVVVRDGAIVVEEQPVPEPGPGQVLVRSRACGICGSDLHMVRHYDEMFEMRKRSGRAEPDATEAPPIFLGHELAGEVAAHGPGTGTHAVGTRVASVPFVMGPDGEMVGVGTNEAVYGAFSEYFVLNEATLIPVPDEVTDEAVALAEPLAVGVHAVARGDVAAGDSVLVIGAGPVGLAVIAALRMRGVETIVASDPVAGRRDMAAAMGASEVIDPTDGDEMERIAELADGGRAVIIECAGVTPLIPSIIERAPAKACVVFAGVHTADVTISPAFAMTKELDLRFTFYYTPEEYAEAFRALAADELEWRPMVTGTVGLDGVADAFETLFGPNDHVKIMVQPWRDGGLETVSGGAS